MSKQLINDHKKKGFEVYFNMAINIPKYTLQSALRGRIGGTRDILRTKSCFSLHIEPEKPNELRGVQQAQLLKTDVIKKIWIHKSSIFLKISQLGFETHEKEFKISIL